MEKHVKKETTVIVGKIGTQHPLYTIKDKLDVISVDDMINFCDKHDVSETVLLTFLRERFTEKITKRKFVENLQALIRENAHNYTTTEMYDCFSSYVSKQIKLFKPN
jgi:hypothetical protein